MKRFESKQVLKLYGGRFVLLVALIAVVWWALSRLDPEVDWLTVEAPREAVAGKLFPVRVNVTALKEPAFLCVDLHWADTRDGWNGFLASGGAQQVGEQGGIYDFEILVQPTNGLRFVNGIVFFSPTAKWGEHTFVAATGKIPVTTGNADGEITLLNWPVREMRGGLHERPSSGTVPRLVTALLLLAASVFAWRNRRKAEIHSEATGGQSWLMVLALLTALACLWELAGLENWIGASARAWARAEDVYYPRALVQKGVISLIFGVTLVFLFVVWRQRNSSRLALLSFGVYLAISAVDLLSFHSLDHYASLSWQGITLVEVLKVACAAATFMGVIHERWRPFRKSVNPSDL